MARSREELEAEILKLSRTDRAELVRQLIVSLDPEHEEDVEAEWIKEAERRYAAYRAGRVAGRSADDVFRSAKSHLE